MPSLEPELLRLLGRGSLCAPCAATQLAWDLWDALHIARALLGAGLISRGQASCPGCGRIELVWTLR
jgi:hypothetical protein